MATLAIKGHATRGKEVIEILEMLGGKISHECGYEDGFDPHYVYFIDTNENSFINGFLLGDKNPAEFSIFTLEEFLEKFPYKIGDKILYKTYGIYLRIKTMLWNVEKERVFYRLGSNKLFVATADELKPYKEEIMEADERSNKELKRLIRKAKSYDKLVSKGFVNIERVCEWLSDNTGKYIIVTGGGYWFNDIEFIKDLKKAMAMEE
jgi:hypothetical protein